MRSCLCSCSYGLLKPHQSQPKYCSNSNFTSSHIFLLGFFILDMHQEANQKYQNISQINQLPPEKTHIYFKKLLLLCHKTKIRGESYLLSAYLKMLQGSITGQ